MLLKNVCSGQVIEFSDAAAKAAVASEYFVPVERPAITAPDKPKKRSTKTTKDED